MPDFDPHAPLDAAARAALRDLRGEHKRYQQEQPKMTMADPHQHDPESPYHQPPYSKAKQPDPEHLGRLGMLEKQVKAYRQAILDEAAAAITGAREDTYGGPEQSFLTIAKFWSAYLDHFIEPQDVAAMLALLKLARLKHAEGQHRDSWVDLAGYAACGAECAKRHEGG